MADLGPIRKNHDEPRDLVEELLKIARQIAADDGLTVSVTMHPDYMSIMISKPEIETPINIEWSDLK